MELWLVGDQGSCLAAVDWCIGDKLFIESPDMPVPPQGSGFDTEADVAGAQGSAKAASDVIVAGDVSGCFCCHGEDCCKKILINSEVT